MPVNIATHRESKVLFAVFCLWSFITLCRPQDYLPLLGLIRPTLSLGILTILAFLLTNENRQNIIENKQFRLYLLLIFIMFLGVPFSYYRSASLVDVFNYSSIGMLIFFLFYHAINTVNNLRRILFWYCCGSAVYAVYVMVFGKLTTERISFGTMFDPNDIAFFILNFIVFNLMFIKKENSGIVRIVGFLNFLIGMIVLVKTGSRGGIIACIAMFAYLLFVSTKTLSLSFMKKAVLVSVIFISLLASSSNLERYKTILDVEDDYNMTHETGRIAIWKIGIRMMLSNPITGVGFGRFNEGVGRDREERGLPSAKWQAPHNSFVQIGADTGIIGLVLFSLLTFRVFRITGQVILTSADERLLMIAEMARAGFIAHCVSAMFLSQAYSVYWVFYIGLSAKLNQMLEEEKGI